MREILYGRNAVRESLRAERREIYKLILTRGVKQTGIMADIVTLANRSGVPIQRVERQKLNSLGDFNHQGVAAETAPYPYAELEEISAQTDRCQEMPLMLMLDCLQDPQNFGALLRTAEIVGVHGVVIPKRRAVGITPAVVNSSAGATEHLLVARVTNLVRTMEELKARGLWIVGLEDVPQAQPYDQSDLKMPLALVVGSEGRGMGRLVRQTCDMFIRLPTRGKINSLNTAIAGSIALYEVWQQRGMR